VKSPGSRVPHPLWCHALLPSLSTRQDKFSASAPDIIWPAPGAFCDSCHPEGVGQPCDPSGGPGIANVLETERMAGGARGPVYISALQVSHFGTVPAARRNT
jgi:hypothetical protein